MLWSFFERPWFFWVDFNLSPSGANMSKLQHFLRDEDGAAAIEYGLLAGLIAAVIIVAVTGIGTSLKGVFGAINTALAAVPGA
jgi:pilus assembly protein Flp/PilA